MKVEIDIGRLVLEGVDVPPHQRPLLQAAVEGELARLIRERGAAPAGPAGVWERARPAPAIRVEPGVSAATLGGRIARAVYGSLWR
ncbi:MAG: hypothetical protein PVF91_11325 [Chromatiales bacterium]|jgi:hypothetical protein